MAETSDSIRALQATNGCEVALEKAINVIDDLETEIGQARALNAMLTKTNASQQATIAQLTKPTAPNPASRLLVTLVKGTPPPMPLQLSVDLTPGAEVVSASFADDHNNPTGAPADPTGAAITIQYGSSDATQATADPASGAISIVDTTAGGTVAFTATGLNADGTPAVYPDGPAAGQAIAGTSQTYTLVAGDADQIVLAVTP